MIEYYDLDTINEYVKTISDIHYGLIETLSPEKNNCSKNDNVKLNKLSINFQISGMIGILKELRKLKPVRINKNVIDKNKQ
ncbi:hypothetical protein FACS189446_8970 [Bacteroidia bacterium]|nr:hypothetical protein FACS189446_8970 [Bacteroidia bacterium]